MILMFCSCEGIIIILFFFFPHIPNFKKEYVKGEKKRLSAAALPQIWWKTLLHFLNQSNGNAQIVLEGGGR